MSHNESLISVAEETLHEAKTVMFNMLSKVVEIGGSDLFISADFPPSIKYHGLHEAAQ